MNTGIATSSDSTRIVFDIRGAGMPVLLLHGVGDSRLDWHTRGYVTFLANERMSKKE